MAARVDPAMSVAAVFARRVRRLRELRGWTQVELAQRVRVHPSRVNQVERMTGHKPMRDLAADMDRELGADGLLTELWPHVYRETFPDWSRKFIELSERAVRISEFVTHVVPGLLQTEDYARAVLRMGPNLKSEEQLAERIIARLARQDRLASDDAPRLDVILDQAVLMRPIGGATVMRGQVRRLLATEHEPRTTVQVLAFEAGEHPGVDGAFTVLTMPDGSNVAYREGLDFGQLIEEPDEVQAHLLAYERLGALALPPYLSQDTLRSILEDDYRDARLPTRSQRRRLAQVKPQQLLGRQLRRGGVQPPRRRAGA
ncbi:putative DNA-binding protein [Actinacidiphila reveromycinica]|uniref:Putative DNA-binding protein n=1 Tax=Actinacidiphila reveromycinica TaxID=659352 RepID=A0A7U3UQT8_9ACTN|nr:helix-turn-helix transcriptional regulator [Streptomyces sp. SN-593]BBA97061.1 putative DNA-binding protein [Streptomyces sp. SN-593]